jgi:hypothetical protein
MAQKWTRRYSIAIDERRQWCRQHRSLVRRTAMKTIVSALIALSVLAGIAAPASALDARSFYDQQDARY